MKLLILSINYAPEPTGFAPHAKDTCTYLAANGHSVEVVTGFPFAPNWKKWPEFRGKIFASTDEQGVRVNRVSHYIPRQASRAIERILMEATFSIMAAARIAARGRWSYDVILYLGAQPAIAMLARGIAGILGRPYVVNIQDLATLAARDVGIIKNPLFLRLLSRFECMAYAGAAGAMVLCASFQAALQQRGYPENRIRLIRCPIDIERIRPVKRDPNTRVCIGIAEDDFVILHSGSMGVKQGLANVVRAAAAMRVSEPKVKWMLVGDGETRWEIARLAAELGVERSVLLRPFVPEKDMASLFAAADLLLLNQLKAVKDTVIPSKLLTYMAAGKPIVGAVNESSQGAQLLRSAGGGVVVEPENPLSLAAAVRRLMMDSAGLPVLGAKNREYAEAHFDRRRILAEQEAFLSEIIRNWEKSANKKSSIG